MPLHAPERQAQRARRQPEHPRPRQDQQPRMVQDQAQIGRPRPGLQPMCASRACSCQLAAWNDMPPSRPWRALSIQYFSDLPGCASADRLEPPTAADRNHSIASAEKCLMPICMPDSLAQIGRQVKCGLLIGADRDERMRRQNSCMCI